MPPLALALLFQRSLPWLTPNGRAVISTLVCDNGRVGSAQELCQRLGLRNRFQLNRLLHREGLPPYEELAGWVCVCYWMLRADADESTGSLRSLAHISHMEAASCYRLVRRVTRHCWKELRRVGTQEVMRWFAKATRPPRSVAAQVQVHAPVLTSATLPPPRELPAIAAAPRADRLLLAGGPHGVAVRHTGDFAYITRTRAAAIEHLDLATGQLCGSTHLGCTPTCVTFSPSGTHAYVSVQYCDEIAVIDTTRHMQVQALPVSGDPFPTLLSESGRTLFVTTNEDRLFGLSPQNGRIIGSLALPATSHHLALHPSGTRLYVATRTGGSVLEVDRSRYEVLRTFQLGGWPQAMAVSADGTMLYVANEQRGLDVVSLATGKRLSTIELDAPVSLALNPEQELLYAGLVHAGKVAVIHVASRTVRTIIETGGRPRQIAFDRRGRAIIANESGWVDLLPYEGHRTLRAGARESPQAPIALSGS